MSQPTKPVSAAARQTEQSDTSMSKYSLRDISYFCGSKIHQMTLVTRSVGGRKSEKRKQSDLFKSYSSTVAALTFKKVTKKESRAIFSKAVLVL